MKQRTVQNEQATDFDRPSKSERKRQMLELQAIGERLINLAPGHLETVPLPDALSDAVAMARQMKKHGALNRQKQYIGKLMRQIDADPIRSALAQIDQEGLTEKRMHHDAERWRERLIAEGMPALEAFVESHPGADRQHLRQCLRRCESSKDPENKTETRKLYRLLHEILATGGHEK